MKEKSAVVRLYELAADDLLALNKKHATALGCFVEQPETEVEKAFAHLIQVLADECARLERKSR